MLNHEILDEFNKQVDDEPRDELTVRVLNVLECAFELARHEGVEYEHYWKKSCGCNSSQAVVVRFVMYCF